MTDALATRPANGTAGQLVPAPAPLDTWQPLDVYAGGLADEAPRLDALATISAGDRGPTREGNKPGLPRRSTDGTIKLHDATGRAPGLRAALEAATPPYKSLTVAFPWDDPALFIQQRFTRYSASALEVYGDERELRVLDAQGQRTVAAGTDDYRRILDTCTVSVSVYFMLAEWEPHPAVVLPDGLGFYRLRFTSRNSLRSILNGLRAVGRFTGGRIAGVPFELRIDYREVADRTGQRRTVPVWVLVMRPPATVRLASSNWAGVMQTALSQGQAFKALPPPSQETLALAEWEGPEVDLDEPQQLAAPSDAEIAQLADGGTCDAEHWKRRWGAVVDGTRFDLTTERRTFIRHFTRGRFVSLKDFLAVATEGDAEALIAAVMAEIEADRSEEEIDPSDMGEGEDWAAEGARQEKEEAALEAEYAEVEEEHEEAPAAPPSAPPAPTPPKRWTQGQLNRFFAQVNPLRPRPTPADIHRILGVEHIQEVQDLDAALRTLFEAWRREHPAPASEATKSGDQATGGQASAARAAGAGSRVDGRGAAGGGGDAAVRADAAPGEQVEHPAGSIEAAWQHYKAARGAAERWNRDNPSAAFKIAPPPSEREATALQVEAYAKHLEDQVAKAFQPIGGAK